jgi:hypothetical protein
VFNTKIIKKMKKEMDASKDMDSMGKYAMEQMKPEKSEEKEKTPDAKIELELMLYNAKASKGKK